MKALVSGYCPIGKTAAFAVEITDSSGAVHKRSVPLKLRSKYQAELAAIKYVCHAIPNKDVELVIKTSISQIPQVFIKTSKGEWIKRKKSNKLVDEVRDLVAQFVSFKCIAGDDEELLWVKKSAKDCLSI